MIRECESRVKYNTQLFAVPLDDTNDPCRLTGKKQVRGAFLDAVPIKRNSFLSKLNFILYHTALNGGNAFL